MRYHKVVSIINKIQFMIISSGGIFKYLAWIDNNNNYHNNDKELEDAATNIQPGDAFFLSLAQQK